MGREVIDIDISSEGPRYRVRPLTRDGANWLAAYHIDEQVCHDTVDMILSAACDSEILVGGPAVDN